MKRPCWKTWRIKELVGGDIKKRRRLSHFLPQVTESEGEKDVGRLSFQAGQPASGAAENLALLLNEIKEVGVLARLTVAVFSP